jgi:hypothetical protein
MDPRSVLAARVEDAHSLVKDGNVVEGLSAFQHIVKEHWGSQDPAEADAVMYSMLGIANIQNQVGEYELAVGTYDQVIQIGHAVTDQGPVLACIAQAMVNKAGALWCLGRRAECRATLETSIWRFGQLRDETIESAVKLAQAKLTELDHLPPLTQ